MPHRTIVKLSNSLGCLLVASIAFLLIARPAFADEPPPAPATSAAPSDGGPAPSGGPGFAASLTRHGLIDEYHLSTVPIAIGEGRSPFANLDEHLKLDVVEEQRFRSGAHAQILVPRR